MQLNIPATFGSNQQYHGVIADRYANARIELNLVIDNLVDGGMDRPEAEATATRRNPDLATLANQNHRYGQ